MMTPAAWGPILARRGMARPGGGTMRSVTGMILASGLVVGMSLSLAASSAHAQGGGLGGYGAMTGGSAMSGAGTGMGAGTVAPFGGRFGAAMPSGMGGGGGVSFRPRASATMSNTRAAFTVGPMVGGM